MLLSLVQVKPAGSETRVSVVDPLDSLSADPITSTISIYVLGVR